MDMHIYIRKEWLERFKAEENKSELINKLLKVYYQKQDTKGELVYTKPEVTAWLNSSTPQQ